MIARKVINGKGKHRILILHGWLHSAERYIKLAEKIENSEIHIYEFEGFGESKSKYKADILNNYAKDICKIIKDNEYDCIISHSMGGNIILKAIEKAEEEIRAKIVLINPAYGGIRKFKKIAETDIMYRALKIKKFMKEPIIKKFALITINDEEKIDELIIRDTLRADYNTAAKTFKELVEDNWRITRKEKYKYIWIIKSEKDRIIRKAEIEMLKNNIGKCKFKIYKNVGHTPVLECFEKLIEDMNRIILSENV